MPPDAFNRTPRGVARSRGGGTARLCRALSFRKVIPWMLCAIVGQPSGVAQRGAQQILDLPVDAAKIRL